MLMVVWPIFEICIVFAEIPQMVWFTNKLDSAVSDNCQISIFRKEFLADFTRNTKIRVGFSKTKKSLTLLGTEFFRAI